MIDDVKKAVAILNKIIAESQPSADEMLDQFIAAKCTYVPGAAMPLIDFFEALCHWAAEQGMKRPHKMKVIRDLPARFVYGCYTNNNRFVGNVALAEHLPAVRNSTPWIARDGRLAREGSRS